MGNQQPASPSVFDLVNAECEEEAIEMLVAGVSVQTIGPSGLSIPRLALEHGLSKLFKFVFALGGEVIPPVECGGTILHKAVLLGHYRLACMFLKEHTVFGNLKNTQDCAGRTPLHFAVERGDPDLVALLLKYNSSAHIKDKQGKTANALALDSKSPHSDEILEQFAVEDCLARVCAMKRVLEDATPVKEGSKSTVLVSETESRPHLGRLEQALVESRVPVIKSADLQYFEVLNRGSSCLVFKGVWRGSEVAIKQFKIEYSTSAKETEKFIKEMQILAAVRHPNLLLLMGICTDQPNLCLITEFIPSSSLFYALHKNKSRKLTLAERFNIGISICRGLAYLHQNEPPIVHRDLKPENCLLDAGMNVKIADFGLARPITAFRVDEPEAMTTVCIGTTRFMAPELFDKDQIESIGVEVDIWALGCVLIELFSNKRPWHYISSSKASSIYYEIFHRRPVPIPETIAPEVRDVINGCCRYNKQRRPGIEEVLSKLEAARSLYILI